MYVRNNIEGDICSCDAAWSPSHLQKKRPRVELSTRTDSAIDALPGKWTGLTAWLLLPQRSWSRRQQRYPETSAQVVQPNEKYVTRNMEESFEQRQQRQPDPCKLETSCVENTRLESHQV
ncbi:hypothetical protein V3C99_008880 [Haemonchus contortus]|uniref:Uncharacterized protein n=1 Tax=Haemonchus contortus TaxID=6289 RepID=A0A7I4YMM3_HAECO